MLMPSLPPFRFLILSLSFAAPALLAQQAPVSLPSAAAQPLTAEASCILAGRLNSEGQWAPAGRGVQLLGAEGQRIRAANPQTLANVKSVRLSQPVWLAKCNGSQALPDGDASTGSKSPAPALKAGAKPISVQALAYAPLRAGGQWVELRLDVPPERVIMLTR